MTLKSATPQTSFILSTTHEIPRNLNRHQSDRPANQGAPIWTVIWVTVKTTMLVTNLRWVGPALMTYSWPLNARMAVSACPALEFNFGHRRDGSNQPINDQEEVGHTPSCTFKAYFYLSVQGEPHFATLVCTRTPLSLSLSAMPSCALAFCFGHAYVLWWHNELGHLVRGMEMVNGRYKGSRTEKIWK